MTSALHPRDTYGAIYRTMWRISEAHDLRTPCPAANQYEYRPAILQTPTSAGGAAHAPEGTSGGRDYRVHSHCECLGTAELQQPGGAKSWGKRHVTKTSTNSPAALPRAAFSQSPVQSFCSQSAAVSSCGGLTMDRDRYDLLVNEYREDEPRRWHGRYIDERTYAVLICICLLIAIGSAAVAWAKW